MASKIVLCVFAVLGQSIAGPWRPIPSSHGSRSISIKEENPVYESIAQIDSYQINPSHVSQNGGPLIVTSISPIAPFGIGVASDVSLTGDLDITGLLPYLSAVAFEGQFDTSGNTLVEYECGDSVAITDQIGGNVGASPYGFFSGSGKRF